MAYLSIYRTTNAVPYKFDLNGLKAVGMGDSAISVITKAGVLKVFPFSNVAFLTCDDYNALYDLMEVQV